MITKGQRMKTREVRSFAEIDIRKTDTMYRRV